MPETFDLQSAFDDLARDVARTAGTGDPDRPIRRARRRRALAGVAAVVVVAALGVTATQVAGVGPDGSAPDIADTRDDVTPGAERRARLLSLLPQDSRQVNVVDVAGFTGEPGLGEIENPRSRGLAGYVMAPFLKLGGPFPRLLFPDLMTYAGTGAADVFLVDRDAEAITQALVRAGWEDQDGALVPGADMGFVKALTGRNVAVADSDGMALVAIARDRGDLPDLASQEALEPGLAASRLIELGGGVGVAFDMEGGGCFPHAMSLTEPTQATMLLGPAGGVTPEMMTVDDLTPPEGVASIDAVAAEGDLVRADLTVEGQTVPLDILYRLGLPGSEFC